MSTAKIALMDYGAGNLPSVERALGRMGAEAGRASSAEALEGCQAVILPGVGHFGALMRTLEERRLLAPLRSAIACGVPFLGICLGLQALYDSSEEEPRRAGLGILSGTVRPLPNTAKLPHMGWNQVRRVRPSVLLRDVPESSFFYFAHSYAALDAGDAAVALCDHSVPFVAALEHKNVLAVQFHPEKSGEAGAQVLRNFLAFAGAEGRP
jgi:imidazole glycerol phosphate synthase glutamine amidotransferase subunit